MPQTTLVVIDMWQDTKGLTCLMYPQVADELMKLVGKHLSIPLKQHSARLCLY
jgi:hypothetical protein